MNYVQYFHDINLREAAVFVTLLPPTVLFGLSSEYLLDFIHYPIRLCF